MMVSMNQIKRLARIQLLSNRRKHRLPHIPVVYSLAQSSNPSSKIPCCIYTDKVIHSRRTDPTRQSSMVQLFPSPFPFPLSPFLHFLSPLFPKRSLCKWRRIPPLGPG